MDEFAEKETTIRTAEKSIFLQRFSAPKLAVCFAFHCYTFEDFAGHCKDFRMAYYRYHNQKRLCFFKEETWS